MSEGIGGAAATARPLYPGHSGYIVQLGTVELFHRVSWYTLRIARYPLYCKCGTRQHSKWEKVRQVPDICIH